MNRKQIVLNAEFLGFRIGSDKNILHARPELSMDPSNELRIALDEMMVADLSDPGLLVIKISVRQC